MTEHTQDRQVSKGSVTLTLSVTEVLPPKWRLRPVRSDSLEYLELVNSIRTIGIVNSILVRQNYELVDGLWRLTAAKQAGLETIPAIYREMSDADALLAQLAANAVRPETTRTDFARQIRRIQKTLPELTLGQLSAFVGKSRAWVKDQLALTDLSTHYSELVDQGMMPARNAYLFAKLPTAQQDALVEYACTLPYEEFAPLARRAVKEGIEAACQLRFTRKMEGRPYVRSVKQVLAAATDPSQLVAELTQGQECPPSQLVSATLRWVLNQSSAS